MLCTLGRWEAALPSADKAVRLQPEDAQAHLARGHVLSGLKDFELALKGYQQAATLRPDFAEAYCHCAAALVSMNQREAAIEQCNKALTINPDCTDALLQRGRALEQMGHVEAAASRLCTDYRAGSRHAPVHVDQGNLYRKLKNWISRWRPTGKPTRSNH